jgi:methylated-DNA-[protein]-cysteine S-methyltransferase
MKTKLTTVPLATPDGTFLARYSEKGLAGLDFPSHRNGKTQAPQGGASARVRPWQRETAAALKRALTGRAPGTSPPLDLSSGTDFQQSVWRALRQIPTGQTRSYGEIARQIGRPKALRAVGGACGANPIPVLVPCHRVLAANRKIGGFSGGLDWKRTLLVREGVQFVG